MSLPSLLILLSVIAAAAFFLAGLLLAPGRRSLVFAGDETQKREFLEREVEKLRRERTAAEAALVEADDKRRAEKSARSQEEQQRRAAEAERDRLGAELEKLLAKEKVASDRLRMAERENRAAFEREEKVAELWAGQLEAAQAEQKRREQAMAQEMAGLRAQLAAEKERKERLGLDATPGVERSPEEAAFSEQLSKERLAQQVERLAQQEEAARAKLAETESAWQARVASTEAAWAAKLVAGEEALRSKLAALEAELETMASQLEQRQGERRTAEAEKETLDLRIRAAEEVAEQRREEAVSAVEALRDAEAKLKEHDRLAKENAELREQRSVAEVEAKQQASREEEARDAKVELAAVQAKLAGLEGVAEENRRLRDEVAELRIHQEASGELERLQAAHKQVRLDAELMARRLQELLHDQAELGPLRVQAAEAAALAQEVEYLRRREKDLEAQLYASGAYASREISALSGELPVVVPGSDLETNLSVLVGGEGARTAVLADGQGFLIAGAGEEVVQEGLAAFAAVAGELVARARMLLPLADVESLRVTDANRMVLTCHPFSSAGTDLGVATLGPAEPKSEDTTRAIAGLAAIIGGDEPESVEPTSAGPASSNEPEPTTT